MNTGCNSTDVGHGRDMKTMQQEVSFSCCVLRCCFLLRGKVAYSAEYTDFAEQSAAHQLKRSDRLVLFLALLCGHFGMGWDAVFGMLVVGALVAGLLLSRQVMAEIVEKTSKHSSVGWQSPRGRPSEPL